MTEPTPPQQPDTPEPHTAPMDRPADVPTSLPPAAHEPEASPKRDGDLVTLRLRRSHLNIAAALVIGFLAGFWLSQLTDEDVIVPSNITAGTPAPGQAVAPPPAQTNVKVNIEGRPIKGEKDAGVTIVEFTDYQCPFCKRHFEEVLPTLLKEYDEDVKYVIKNLPLPQL